MIHKLPFNGQWNVFSDKDLLAMPAEDAEALRELLRQYESNRLSFFLAHGQQMDYVNDDETAFSVIYAPNRTGKTLALIHWLARRAIPVKDYWHTVRNHGFKMREWNGPRKVAVASYLMNAQMQRLIWPAIAEIFPADELKEYSTQWKPKDKRVKRKHPNWTGSPVIPLDCGTQIDFFAYHQSQEAFESMPYDFWGFDEQPPEARFDGAWARMLTIDDSQACAALTPHPVEGRPDTGAHCWIVRMTSGLLDKGIDFKTYQINMDDVPDAIISKKNKANAYEKNVLAPQRDGDPKAIRKGRSRYYGTPESSEGLVYDNWDAPCQWIDPFEIPTSWTKYRGVDPGRVDPFAVLWAAIAPWGDMVLYREYYERGLGMEDNVVRIIEKSGNKRSLCGEMQDEYGNIRKRYEEVMDKEQYVFSAMDPRTFASPSQQVAITQGQIFASMGLRCVPAPGTRNEQAVPIVKERLEPIPKRPHILVRMGLKKEVIGIAGKPITSAPRFYVFNTLNRFRGEIEMYCNRPESERPMDKDDHLMTALKYLILLNPRYDGPPTGSQSAHGSDTQPATRGNLFTGYVQGGSLIT